MSIYDIGFCVQKQLSDLFTWVSYFIPFLSLSLSLSYHSFQIAYAIWTEDCLVCLFLNINWKMVTICIYLCYRFTQYMFTLNALKTPSTLFSVSTLVFFLIYSIWPCNYGLHNRKIEFDLGKWKPVSWWGSFLFCYHHNDISGTKRRKKKIWNLNFSRSSLDCTIEIVHIKKCLATNVIKFIQ